MEEDARIDAAQTVNPLVQKAVEQEKISPEKAEQLLVSGKLALNKIYTYTLIWSHFRA